MLTKTNLRNLIRGEQERELFDYLIADMGEVAAREFALTVIRQQHDNARLMRAMGR